MAITLAKKKVAPAPAPVELLSDYAALIDRVGRLGKEAEKIQARIRKEQEKLKPYQEAMAELKAALDGLEADDEAVIEELGAEFRVEAGKRGSSRRISDMQKVRELMGDELFFQVATVALKDVDAYLTQPQRDQVIAVTRTGRSVKVVERA